MCELELFKSTATGNYEMQLMLAANLSLCGNTMKHNQAVVQFFVNDFISLVSMTLRLLHYRVRYC